MCHMYWTGRPIEMPHCKVLLQIINVLQRVCVHVHICQDTYAHIQPEEEEASTTNNAARQTTETPLKTWWEGPLPDRFLPGQSSDTLYQNLSEAQAACLKLAITGQEFSKVLSFSLTHTHLRWH
jgi:hypothetical protein